MTEIQNCFEHLNFENLRFVSTNFIKSGDIRISNFVSKKNNKLIRND